MQSARKFITAVLFILWGTTSVAQEAPNISTLLTELNRPKTADRAARQILQAAAKDPKARQFVVESLPAMISKQQTDEVWLNAVHLAGQLKATEAIPALESALARGPLGAPMTTTFGTQMRLLDDAVAKALSQIGDPAIPAVTNRLDNGDAKMRRRVVLILTNIGSPASRKVLKDRLPHEPDPKIRYLIESALRS